MYQIVLLIHVFAAVCIIALVLVQQGKGASVGAAFGSGASQTVFGSKGSGSFLFRLTMSLAGIFFVTSLAMNYMATRAVKQEKAASMTMPALPVAPVAPTAADTMPAVDVTTPPALPVTLPARNR